jgi:hypothetical protein
MIGRSQWILSRAPALAEGLAMGQALVTEVDCMELGTMSLNRDPRRILKRALQATMLVVCGVLAALLAVFHSDYRSATWMPSVRSVALVAYTALVFGARSGGSATAGLD